MGKIPLPNSGLGFLQKVTQQEFWGAFEGLENQETVHEQIQERQNQKGYSEKVSILWT
jgi:hypothetical protein